jgi:pSer/pThr/pTyr-binding forkhead associated (FHA) protein
MPAEPPPTATSVPSATSEPVTAQVAEIDEGTKGRAFAYIRYVDKEGPKVVDVTKNQIIIGRGGRSYWVDLKLETLPDVSREHCRIRRDSETGRFTIEDLSQFGTAVNGAPVGRNASAELPRRATISLAGVIDLQWEAA